MKLNFNSFLYSVAKALDSVENEIMVTSKHHSKRVTFIALSLATEMGFDEKRKFDLFAYSLLHDNGIIQAYRATKQNDSFLDVDNIKEHCRFGEENLKNFPFFFNEKNIILYHHEAYDGSGYFGKKGNEIPLISQLIFIADCLDSVFDLSNITYATKLEVEKYLQENQNRLFSSFIVQAFLNLAQRDIFWYDLESSSIEKVLNRLLPANVMDISYEKLLEISMIFSTIVDSKSKYTTNHTYDLLQKVKQMSLHYNLSQEKTYIMQISANLHHIGKLGIPKEILEKEGSLTKEERFIIKKLSGLTHIILDNIEGLEEISSIASAHHERLDGSGYPFGLTREDLKFEHRLLAVLDMYQALVEDRPQRSSLSHKEAIEIMKKDVAKGRLDCEIVDSVEEVFSKSS